MQRSILRVVAIVGALACCLLAVLTHGAPAAKSAATSFQVGGAYADVTPDHGMPNYNGDHLEPDKDATPLRVQAIVLDDGTTRAAIISVDCTFLGRIEVGCIRDAIHQRSGLKPENICIAATHSHAVPATTASFLTGELPQPEYINLLVEKCSQAVANAITKLKPARVVAATIDAPPIGVCRRRIDAKGQAYMTGTEPKSKTPLPPEHPIDEKMQYAIFEGMDGKPLAAMFNFSCHNNMIHRVFSADFFGRAGDELRAKFGNMATVMLAAPCGDVAWHEPGGKPTYPSDRAAGHAIADAILTSYKSHPQVSSEKITIRSVLRQIPDRPYDPNSLHYDNGRGAGASARENFMHRYKSEDAAVRKNGDTKCDVEIQAIAFGDVAIVTNPAELFSIYGVKIKEASPYKVTFVSELSNGYCGYVPTPDSFQHGGYETYRTVYTSRLAKDGGDRIMQESIDLLKAVHGEGR